MEALETKINQTKLKEDFFSNKSLLKNSLFLEHPKNNKNYSPIQEKDYWEFPVILTLIGIISYSLEFYGIGSLGLAGAGIIFLSNLYYSPKNKKN